MSASTERKNRQAAREAGVDKKMLAQLELDKKKAQSKRRWTLGSIGVALLIAIIFFLDSSFMYTQIPALTIGDESYSAAEVDYFYAEQFYSFYQQYGSYASAFGLDVSGGVAGLDSQDCSLAEGSWKDYFMASAINQMTTIQSLCSYADENGIVLDEDEIADVDAQIASLTDTAKSYNYTSANKYLASSYGKGVTTKTARNIALNQALASKVATQMEDSLEYSEEELEEYYQGLNGASDVFNYVYYYVPAEKVSVAGEDGAEPTDQVTEETLAAAKETADDILAAYEEEDGATLVRLNRAVGAFVADNEATESGNVTGSNLGVFADWMLDDSRVDGDAQVIESSASDGYYVAAFLSRNDNHYPTAQVRHILIKAVASEDGTYSDEAKLTAKNTAEDIYKQWKDGEATEESFAALAEQYSEDPGSNTNGGLYDNIPRGQMVAPFENFCFADHKPGDTDLIFVESTNYTGYHIMYYVGEGQLYSDYIAKANKSAEDMSTWLESLTEGLESSNKFAMRFTL